MIEFSRWTGLARNVATIHRFCGLLLVAVLLVISGRAAAADTIKIAFIDALSGPYADIGFTALKQYQEAIAYANGNGGALGLKLELVPLDDKASIEQALGNLELAIKQGIRYITQGNNPEISAALASAIDAHNQANPNSAVLFLNYGDGVSEGDTNPCSFWQFRFDSSIAMKLHVLAESIPIDGGVQSIYFLNQDDAWGRSASRQALQILTRLRPGIEIVGDELHPVGGVKDFAAYFARVAESGAAAILTANRGADLAALLQEAGKAANPFAIYVLSSSLSDAPVSIGKAGADRVFGVFTWHANIGANQLSQFASAYRKKHDQEWNGLPAYMAVQMLVTSIETARSLEPIRVAGVLGGLSFLGATGPTAMRDDNHQLLQPLFVSVLTMTGTDGAGNAVAVEWHTMLRKEAEETYLETACKMTKPRAVKQR